MYKVNGELFSYGSTVAEFERATYTTLHNYFSSMDNPNLLKTILLGFWNSLFLIQSTLLFEDTSPLKSISAITIRLHLALIPLFVRKSILVFQNYATLDPSIKQIRHVQIHVASLSNMLTKSLGQCLRKCTALEEITVSSGGRSAALTQIVKSTTPI